MDSGKNNNMNILNSLFFFSFKYLEIISMVMIIMNMIIHISNLAIENSGKYSCPRCGNASIYEYEESFDCINCKKEFEKQDVEEFDDEFILSIEEKLAFIESLLAEI